MRRMQLMCPTPRVSSIVAAFLAALSVAPLSAQCGANPLVGTPVVKFDTYEGKLVQVVDFEIDGDPTKPNPCWQYVLVDEATQVAFDLSPIVRTVSNPIQDRQYWRLLANPMLPGSYSLTRFVNYPWSQTIPIANLQAPLATGLQLKEVVIPALRALPTIVEGEPFRASIWPPSRNDGVAVLWVGIGSAHTPTPFGVAGINLSPGGYVTLGTASFKDWSQRWILQPNSVAIEDLGEVPFQTVEIPAFLLTWTGLKVQAAMMTKDEGVRLSGRNYIYMDGDGCEEVAYGEEGAAPFKVVAARFGLEGQPTEDFVPADEFTEFLVGVGNTGPLPKIKVLGPKPGWRLKITPEQSITVGGLVVSSKSGSVVQPSSFGGEHTLNVTLVQGERCPGNSGARGQLPLSYRFDFSSAGQSISATITQHEATALVQEHVDYRTFLSRGYFVPEIDDLEPRTGTGTVGLPTGFAAGRFRFVNANAGPYNYYVDRGCSGLAERIHADLGLVMGQELLITSYYRNPNHTHATIVTSLHSRGTAVDIATTTLPTRPLQALTPADVYRSARRVAGGADEVLLERYSTALIPQNWDVPTRNASVSSSTGVSWSDTDGNGLPDTLSAPLVPGAIFQVVGASGSSHDYVVDVTGFDLLLYRGSSRPSVDLDVAFSSATHVHVGWDR